MFKVLRSVWSLKYHLPKSYSTEDVIKEFLSKPRGGKSENKVQKLMMQQFMSIMRFLQDM